MLFIDYSSAFNTIVHTSLCNWLLDFLKGRPQVVRIGNNMSATLTLNTRQGVQDPVAEGGVQSQGP